jgi:WD40 repeat protein
VHRDIKPSNLLLDTHGIVWVTDFGLAKADDQQNLTHTGDILGTLRYMPPEAFGGKVDSRGDVYALGLTLYEMLAFRPAFDERERGRLVKQVTGEAPAPLHNLNPEVPRDLETIVQKAIEREPSHRYASASDLGDDLRRFVDDEPIRARRTSYAERLARWGRRNPALAALSGVVAVLALVVIGSLWYGKESARRALRVQTALRGEADARARQAAAAEARARAEAGRADAQAGESRRNLYAAQINLAQAAWDSAMTARTHDLLEATRPRPEDPDFRGFEWSYYRRRVHSELAVRKLPGYELDSTPGPRVPPVLSHDGALVARVLPPPGHTSPRLLVIHETATGRLLRQIPLPALTGDESFTRLATRLTFSADGARLALVSGNAVASSLTGTRDTTFELHAFVWSVADGRELLHDSWTIAAAPRYVSTGLALTRDGGRLALATHQFAGSDAKQPEVSGELRVLEVADGREQIHLTAHSEGYLDPALSPDGRFVATSGRSYRSGAGTVYTGRLVLLEVESGRSRTDLEEPEIPAWSARFSPDGRFLAMVTQDSVQSYATALVVCDLAAGRRLATEPLPGALAYLGTAGFSPDGRALVLASGTDAVCEVREVPSGRLVRKLSLGASGTQDLAIRPSDGRLITVDTACNIREWPLPPAQPAAPDSGRGVEQAEEAALYSGGRALIAMQSPSGPNERTRFAVHDVATGQVLRRFERRAPGTPTRINHQGPLMTFASLGSRFVFPVVIGDARTTDHFEVWDSATGQQITRLDAAALGGGLPFQMSLVAPMALDARATRLAVRVQITAPRVGDNGERIIGDHAMAIVELPSGRLLRKIPLAHYANAVALSPDGRTLATDTIDVSSTGERRPGIQLHDTDSGRVVRTLQASPRSVDKLAFSSDGLQLAAASFSAGPSGPIEVWNLAAGAAPVPIQLDGHAFYIRDLAFSASGRRLASLSNRNSFASGELKLWDTTSGRDLVTWALPPGVPITLAFDGDDRLRVLHLARGASEARVTLFDASPLTPEVEAADVVDRLGPRAPLNSVLAERIQAEPGLDPAVRTAALALVPLRQEGWSRLIQYANRLLGGSPAAQHRALVYAERAVELAADMGSVDLRTLGEARYRNGKLTECLDPLRRSLTLQDEEHMPAARRIPRALAFIAMAEAKLGHRELAQAALDEYRTRLGRASGGSMAKPSEDRLLAEAEGVLRAAFPP